MEVKYKIKESTLNAVLNYLSEQPYKSVVGLIQAVSADIQANKTESIRKAEKVE